MNVELARLGGLNCRVVDTLPPETPPKLVAILCHGYGAPGTDLVPIGAELLQMNPGLRDKVRFVFPEAPLSLASLGMPGGRAWWNLNVARLMESIESGDFGDLRQQTPPGIEEARALMMQLIDEVRSSTGLATSRIVLGGFSQGSMLTTDVALRLPAPPAALCVMSGTLICEQEWTKLAASRGKLPILQSHGLQDPILPYQGAEALREMFLAAGFEVDFVSFPGPHTIPFDVLHRLASLLEAVASPS